MGTYRSQEERNRPYIRELSGMRFGFLSYTYGTNAFFHHNYLSADNHWAVNLLQPEEGRPGAIDLLNRKTVSTRVKMLYEQDHPLFREHIASYLEQLKQDILALRKAGAEFLVMLLHCGGQHDIEPDDYTKWIVRWLDEQKVDLIIGNHQHILHPCVKLKHAFVAYCLGNLTDTPDYNPNGRGIGEEYSVLLQCEFEKFQGKVRMQNVGLIPVISVLDKHGQAVVYEVTDLISNRCKNGEQQSLLRDLAHFVNLMREPMTNHPWTWRPFILWAKKGEVMASIRVDANFPGGAVENVEINNLTIVFEAPLDNSPQSLWYFFRVIGAQGQRLTLIQKGLDHVLGVHESRGYGP